MIREVYINKVSEITLNVTQTKVDSIRKKSITKTGCRVYKDGYIGVAGTLGEATEDTWNEAIKNLENKVPYKAEPSKNDKRFRDLRKSKLSAEEFLSKADDFLDKLRQEFQEFTFGNKIKSIETEITLKNDAGLEYVNIDRYFEVSLIVKDVNSVNVFDTMLAREDRDFDTEALLKDARYQLTNYGRVLELNSDEKIPVIATFGQFSGKIVEALNGNELNKGSSIFANKIGKESFSKEFTVYVDRSEENLSMPFFDAEGSIIEEDKFNLIENGRINYGYTDKNIANKFDVPNTAASVAAYDDVPSIQGQGLGEKRLSLKVGDRELSKILGDKEAIFAVFMEGGDCTNEGDFASPVQMSYLFKDGKIVGRLPEFSVYGNIYEMFGEDYLGQTSDRCYFGEHAVVLNMNIK